MLSINIPVFQVEVSTLVLQLHRQAEKLKISFEIRVYDDGSTEDIRTKNREIKNLPNVVYSELAENRGRAAIRNKMGLDSNFKYLLFIDADSCLVSENYLQIFLENIKPNRVICGGTAYKPDPPEEPGQILRWVYGSKREAVSAQARNSKKGFIITSNNFVIERRIFEKIHFREDLRKYGHEDTLLGYDLYQNDIEIFHIENPVEHTGLEESRVFLEKTRLALKNLHFISNDLLNADSTFIQQVSFLNRYQKLTKYFPSGLLALIYKAGKRSIEMHLSGRNPKLFWFDLYKIAFYSVLTNVGKKA